LLAGIELEAYGYHVIDGGVVFYSMVASLVDGPLDMEIPIIEYLPGVVRSVCAVGAFTEATARPPPQEPSSENPRRR
jgi:hypothetical protein